MIWDILMGCSSIILALSLLPQIIHNIQSKRCDIVFKTSLTTAIPLTLTSVSMLALGLYFAGGFTLLTTIMWWVIVYQRKMYN